MIDSMGLVRDRAEGRVCSASLPSVVVVDFERPRKQTWNPDASPTVSARAAAEGGFKFLFQIEDA